MGFICLKIENIPAVSSFLGMTTLLNNGYNNQHNVRSPTTASLTSQRRLMQGTLRTTEQFLSVEVFTNHYKKNGIIFSFLTTLIFFAPVGVAHSSNTSFVQLCCLLVAGLSQHPGHCKFQFVADICFSPQVLIWLINGINSFPVSVSEYSTFGGTSK